MVDVFAYIAEQEAAELRAIVNSSRSWLQRDAAMDRCRERWRRAREGHVKARYYSPTLRRRMLEACNLKEEN